MDNRCLDSTGNRFRQCRGPRRQLPSRHRSRENRLNPDRWQRHPDSPRQVPELLRRRRDNRQHRMDNRCLDSTGNRFRQCRAPRRQLPSRHRSRENRLNPDRWQRHPDSPRQVPELLRRRRDNRQHRMDNRCLDSTGNRFRQCRAPRRQLPSRHRSRENRLNPDRWQRHPDSPRQVPELLRRRRDNRQHRMDNRCRANHQRRHRPLTQ